MHVLPLREEGAFSGTNVEAKQSPFRGLHQRTVAVTRERDEVAVFSLRLWGLNDEPEVAPTPQEEDAAGLMLKAMIQAAKSDGKIDEAEKQKLLANLGDVSEAERDFVNREISAPVDVQALAFETGFGRTLLEYYDGFVFGFYAEGSTAPISSGGRYRRGWMTWPPNRS